MSTFLNTFDDSKRALAKLMARENITVQVIDNLKTADFNTVSRILRIPNWPNLTADQTDLLIGHEVGHALFTDYSYIEKLVTRKRKGQPIKGLMTYFNVIEDTRIERKMRHAFPGLRRSFYQGYQAFMATGPIFLMNDKQEFVHPTTKATLAVAKMRLIDRINIHYKLGAFVQVPFTAAEQLWLDRIDRCYSQDDALKIAEEMHALAKDQESSDDQGPGAKSKSKSKGKSKGKAPRSNSKDDQDLSDNDDTEGADGAEGDESDDDTNEADGESESDGSSDGESDDDGASEAGEEGETGDSPDDADADADANDRGDDGDAVSSAGDGAVDAKTGKKPSADGAKQTAAKTGHKTPNQAEHTKESDAYEKPEIDPASFTDDANAEGLTKAAEPDVNQAQSQKIVHLLIKPLSDKLVKDRTISARDWSESVCTLIDKTIASAQPCLASFLKLNETAWNDAYLATAKHMALEFGRKKSAKNLARIRIGKTGKINPGKLHAYKFSDDLFLRSMTIPNGQSHGIVMIVDASGSMETVFGSVLDQVLLFANFAKSANLPFECYLFTTSGRMNQHEHYQHGEVNALSMGPQTLTLPASGRLVGLINTMDGSFKKQMRALHAYRTRWGSLAAPGASAYSYGADVVAGYAETVAMANTFPYASLGSTPLYAGLMIAERHVERMKRTLKLDKIMQVVITDGEDGESLFYETQEVDSYTGCVKPALIYAGGTALVVRDSVTKKNHVLVEEYLDAYSGKTHYYLPANALLQLLLDVNKDRHAARNIMIFLAAGGRKSGNRVLSSLTHLLRANIVSRSGVMPSVVGITEEAINKAFEETSQYAIPSKYGVADLVLVLPQTTVRLHDQDFKNLDTSLMTQRKIASTFVKSLNVAKTNRVFVNTVIPYLA